MRPVVTLLISAMLLSACTGSGSKPAAQHSSGPESSGGLASTRATSATPLAGMTLAATVGQLFIVGVTPDDPAGCKRAAQQHAGGVFLRGRITLGTARTRSFVTNCTKALGTSRPWVATDQEGGAVQVLKGPGFSTIPSAVSQAQQAAATLRTNATAWGKQLKSAGVNLNLAPVADLVPNPANAAKNPPIGAFDRNYGFGSASTVRGAGAFASGMRASDVVPTLKHFPGLGRATGNTDVTADVTDPTISATSPDVKLYRPLLRQAAKADVPTMVMMSLAVYPKLDPRRPAAFSRRVATELLRDQLGFRGVIITDDLSAAKAVAKWPAGQRAVLAIDAGVDIVLASADDTVLPAMYDAVLAKAKADPAFRAKVQTAAARIGEARTTAAAAR